jgi:hypothetical protein
MTRDPFVHHLSATAIDEWLAGRGGTRSSVSYTRPVPLHVDPPRVLTAEEEFQNMGPLKVYGGALNKTPRPDTCAHCGGPLPAIRSARKAYCSRRCSLLARRAAT